MDPWRLPETHKLVLTRFGRGQERLTQDCTRSIVDRQNFARYHYQEVRRLAKQFEQKYLAERLSLIELHASDRMRTAFEGFILKAGAHATACVQSVHAIPDILANAIYYAAALNLTSAVIPEHQVGVASVAKLLRRVALAPQLAQILSKATQGSDWEYLSAVSNTSKHRSVVRSSFNEDWTGKRKNRRELQFSMFERGDKHYRSRSFEDTIGPEYDRIGKVVIETGHELNNWLRAA